MQIGDIIIGGIVIPQRIGSTVGIVEEVKSVATTGLPQQLAAGIVIGMDGAVYILACAQAVVVVGVIDLRAALGGFGKIPAFLPFHCPAGAIVIADGIAAGGRPVFLAA